MGIVEILIYGGSIVIGLTLAFTGVLIYEVAVTLIAFFAGFVFGLTGLSSGIVVAPGAFGSLQVIGAAILLGLLSVWLVWALIQWAIMFPGFIAGAGVTVLLFRKLLPPLPEESTATTTTTTGGVGLFDLLQSLSLLIPVLIVLYLIVRGVIRRREYLIGFVNYIIMGIIRPPIAIFAGLVGLEELYTRITSDEEDIGELWFEFQKHVIGLVLNPLIFFGIPLGILHYFFGVKQLISWGEMAIKVAGGVIVLFLLGILRPLAGGSVADLVANIVLLLSIAGGIIGAGLAWRFHQIGIALGTAVLGGVLVALAAQMPQILSLVASLRLNRIVEAIETTSTWFFVVFILGVLTQTTLYVEGVTE